MPFSGLHAGDSQAVDSLFFRGVAAYERGDYQDALKAFEFIDRVYPSHRRLTASLLMQGKTLYAKNENQRALEGFRELIHTFPKSAYADHARYGMALCHLRLGNTIQSVRELLSIVESGTDQRLIRKSAGLSSDVMDKRMRIDELHTLLDETEGEKTRAVVTLRLAKREMDAQNYQAARKVLQNYLDQYPRGAYVFQAEELLQKVEALGHGMTRIGVILPLTGPFSDQGNGLLSGIEYAIKIYNQESASKIELIIHDSGSRMLTAIRAAQELCANPEVLAIIGELNSDITAGIAGVAQAAGVSLLSPLAAEAGLTEIGAFIFQLNASLDIRARTLAEYAIQGLGNRRFAFLGVGDSYGRIMYEAFVRSARSQGVQMLSEKWFFSGARDFSEQFKGIRQDGIVQMLRDSVLIIVNDLEKVTDPRPYVQYVNQPLTALTDSADLAVTAIDGIFIPAYTEELQYLIPQLAFYNIKARILGGVPWHDEPLLDRNAQYIEGAVFLSDFFPGPSDFRYYRFRDAYRKDQGVTPGKMDVFGYDAASLIIAQVKDGTTSRIAFRDKLEQVRGFPGVRGAISFDSGRVNPHISLLQFNSGRIQKIR